MHLFLLVFWCIRVDFGSAYGTAKSGVGITSMGVLRPDLIIKSVVPVVMAGILGIYGLIISVVINQKISASTNYNPKIGFAHLAAGLCNGLSSLVREESNSRERDWLLD